MKTSRRSGSCVEAPSAFAGFRFPPVVILLAVRWYLWNGLSYRDLEELLAERGIDLTIPIGTMIELPRAALTAGRIAEAADFFSFGTNDLTQTTWGFSRDAVEAAFLAAYLEKGIFTISPFETIDADGVGELITTAVTRDRATRPDLHLGVCGEHGGDPDSSTSSTTPAATTSPAAPTESPSHNTKQQPDRQAQQGSLRRRPDANPTYNQSRRNCLPHQRIGGAEVQGWNEGTKGSKASPTASPIASGLSGSQWVWMRR